MKAKLTTKGLEEYLERLAQKAVDIDAAAAAALTAGGDVLVQGERGRVPVDTGNLKEHIAATEPKQDGNFVYIEVGLVAADAETAIYGAAQEYGTARMEANPYHRPTMDVDLGKARKAMRDSLEQAEML